MAWQSIDTAPKDGTIIWGWLYDMRIVAVRWMSAEEAAEEDGHGNSPDDYLEGWVMVQEPDDYWSPKWWQPMHAIGVPPNVILAGGKWRDLAKSSSQT